MATKSPTIMHNQWPNVSDPTELPNVSGATIQDQTLEKGDQCFSLSDSTTYQCTLETLGGATWTSFGGGAPASHASTHEPGGGDAMTVDAAAGTGSLRTLGTGSTNACAGNDSRLSDARTPTSHASSHDAGGGDAMAIDAAAGTGSLRTLGTGSTNACAGNDSRLSDARTPTSHASSHDAGGGDAMAIDAAAGTGSLRTLGTGSTNACAGNDSRLSDARTPTSHATSHESGGGDVIAHQNLSGAGTNAHSAIDTHLGSSSNPHTVTAAQVGNTTAQWNADKLQGDDIDSAIAPTDGQVLTYDGTGTQWIAASPAEGTSYLELGTDHTFTSAGGSPDSDDVGRAVFDGGQHNTITFRAVVHSVYATTGSSDVKLYDDGTPSTPGTPRLVTTLTAHTDDSLAYEVFEQALTVVTSGPSTNEILDVPRVYRAVVEITATSGDTITVDAVGLIAVGNGDVVTLSADAVQAIAMSLNA